MGADNNVKPIFYGDSDKKPKFPERLPRPQVVGKYTLSKRITGDWHLEKKFDRFPTDYGVNTHRERD